MDLTVDLETGRTACAESIEAFLRAVDDLSEHDLLAPSRCHGWTLLDVVVHVIAGWQEMLGGLVSPIESEPTVDAATYWPAFAEQYASNDPIPALMSQRRRTAAFARPSSATAQLRDVGAALLRGVSRCAEGRYLWDTHVFAAGDFLAVWAVEGVVHHLDLDLDGGEPAPGAALRIARTSIESLVGESLPGQWPDVEAVLIGTGRCPVPAGLGVLTDRLPALG
ncbi:maleylpyruvate isomerase N-terminal domain-containing protein [Nocardioides ferulae]|uniref:maleylpyruvate isomerase N-terminal domain-containing protein n=1 Tax=Nocardioides ferulae TaxID=2340821 RepID=UPI0013DD93DA|nr:maleylpyruvate isomerase N-terminal domain-containing protein [Nocardioides ferulae]